MGGIKLQILYGTTNPAKLQYMRDMLEELDFDIIGLNEIYAHIDNIDEKGNNPLENAKIKAMAYYKAIKMPVFSCDSGLYIAGLEDENQPGVHVRRINGKVLSDDQMLEYYANFVLKLGGKVIAEYRNAICLIFDEENIFSYDGDDIASVKFLLTSKIHAKKNVGFPLDSLSVDIETGKYFLDMQSVNSSAQKSSMSKGFRDFFLRSLLKYRSLVLESKTSGINL